MCRPSNRVKQTSEAQSEPQLMFATENIDLLINNKQITKAVVTAPELDLPF